MIRTDGIRTIANAEPRIAEKARRLPPSVRDVRLTDAQWDSLVSLCELALNNVTPIYDDERSAFNALRSELDAR